MSSTVMTTLVVDDKGGLPLSLTVTYKHEIINYSNRTIKYIIEYARYVKIVKQSFKDINK